jgi:hypothetical protein
MHYVARSPRRPRNTNRSPACGSRLEGYTLAGLIPMICSSVYRDRFIRPSPSWSGLYFLVADFSGSTSPWVSCRRYLAVDAHLGHRPDMPHSPIPEPVLTCSRLLETGRPMCECPLRRRRRQIHQ